MPETTTNADTIELFEAAVELTMADRGISRAEATRAVSIERPKLHTRYLKAYNEQHGRKPRGA